MKNKGFLYAILAGILWGTSGLFVSAIAPLGFTSLQMTLFRSLISAVCMLGCILFRDRSLLKATAKELLLFAAGGLGFFGTSVCYFVSMQMTSVSTAVVLMYTAPVIVMIYSVAFLGEKLTPLKTVAVVGMVAGCILVSGVVGGLKFNTFGIIMGLLAGISYSAYNIVAKIEMRNRSNPITATFYRFVFGTVLSLSVCSPATLLQGISDGPAYTLPLLLALGIVTCVLPYLFHSNGMKHLPAGTVSALCIVEPLSATIFSVTLLHESLTVYSLCGIIVIIGSVILLNRSEKGSE